MCNAGCPTSNEAKGAQNDARELHAMAWGCYVCKNAKGSNLNAIKGNCRGLHAILWQNAMEQSKCMLISRCNDMWVQCIQNANAGT